MQHFQLQFRNKDRAAEFAQLRDLAIQDNNLETFMAQAIQELLSYYPHGADNSVLYFKPIEVH